MSLTSNEKCFNAVKFFQHRILLIGTELDYNSHYKFCPQTTQQGETTHSHKLTSSN